MTHWDALLNFERTYWSDVLDVCNGNVTQAAALAGVNRTALYAILERIGLHVAESPGNQFWHALDNSPARARYERKRPQFAKNGESKAA